MAIYDRDLFAAGAGGLGAGLGGLFAGWDNPADAAMPTLSGIPEKMSPYYQPYIQSGQRQIPDLEGRYGELTNDPGGFINRLGGGYKESPGFQFALKRALGASNNAAAAGGMAGSPQAMEWSQDIASNMASRDFNKWLETALGAYGRGLTGREHMSDMGAEMGRDFGNTIGNIELQKAMLAYLGQNAENQRSGGIGGALGTGIGMIGGALIGGPAGAGLGASAVNAARGLF